MTSRVAPVALGTERLFLRPFRLSDLVDVQVWAGDPEVTRFLRWGPNDPGETRRFLVRAVKNAATEEAKDLDLAIVERASGRVRGGAAIHRRAPGRVEIGYVFARPAWGRGYATETVHALLEFLGRVCPDGEVFGLVVPGNDASARVLERCGFRRTGDTAPYRPWMEGLCSTARVYRLRLRGSLRDGFEQPEGVKR